MPVVPRHHRGLRHGDAEELVEHHPGPVYVKIGKPIDTKAFAEDDREGLIKAVRDVIIAQSLELGGKGGDRNDAIAAAGSEGVGRDRRIAS